MNSTPMPPRFVPTLTEVVYPPTPVNLVSLPSDTNASTASAPTSTDVSLRQFEDQLLHRVMQRVDLVLEQRLREAVSPIILTHIQNLGPRLREEIEMVVRESLSQAIAQEIPLSVASD